MTRVIPVFEIQSCRLGKPSDRGLWNWCLSFKMYPGPQIYFACLLNTHTSFYKLGKPFKFRPPFQAYSSMFVSYVVDFTTDNSLVCVTCTHSFCKRRGMFWIRKRDFIRVDSVCLFRSDKCFIQESTIMLLCDYFEQTIDRNVHVYKFSNTSFATYQKRKRFPCFCRLFRLCVCHVPARLASLS